MNPLLEILLGLLAKEPDEIARRCEEIAKSGVPGLSTFDLSLERTRDVYYLRGELNAERGHPIKGFEGLVANLQKETEPMIGIHSIEVGPREFQLFTDSAVTRLIGILLFPTRSKG